MNLAYRPMLATLVSEPFDDKDWVFETKWDGFRLVTEKRGDKVTLWLSVAAFYATGLGTGVPSIIFNNQQSVAVQKWLVM